MDLALPGTDTDDRQRERRQQLDQRRAEYELDAGGGMPPGARRLPDAETLGNEKVLRMFDDLVGSGLGMAPAAIENLFGELAPHHRTLEFYEHFYPRYLRGLRPMPLSHDCWSTDEEFARQRLAGVNPVLVERCTQLPEHFPVDDGTVAGLLPAGATLRGEMEAGRVYIVDYVILDGITTAPGRYLAAPICLFHVGPDGALRPLAIQLGQSPAAGPVFTPRDPHWLWTVVKMYAQSADAAYHEVASHLLRTHLISEAVYLCLKRQLAERHPLHELLAPHFWQTMAINHAAKTQLIVPGGPIDQTMAAGGAQLGSGELLGRAWKQWKFDRYDLRTDLRLRGVDDAELLPGYLYRDDAVRIWDILERYVRGIVGAYYTSPADVAGDTELQAWVAEMASPQGGQLKGLPGDGSVATIDQLVQLVTQIIFTASAEHASVNNGQFDYFGYIPNVPGALTAPPPTTKDALTEQDVASRMPNHHKSAVQIAMVHMLSLPTEQPLGTYHPGFFASSPQAQAALATLRSELGALSKDIDARNAGLAVPYPYLNPRLVAQSIAV